MTIKLTARMLYTEEGWETIEHTIMIDEKEVGNAAVVVPPAGEDNDRVYLENIDIDEDHQGKGYGTKAIKELAKKYGYIYFAPTNVDNKRLYDRIAKEVDCDAPEVDQGFGVYYLEG